MHAFIHSTLFARHGVGHRESVVKTGKTLSSLIMFIFEHWFNSGDLSRHYRSPNFASLIFSLAGGPQRWAGWSHGTKAAQGSCFHSQGLKFVEGNFSVFWQFLHEELNQFSLCCNHFRGPQRGWQGWGQCCSAWACTWLLQEWVSSCSMLTLTRQSGTACRARQDCCSLYPGHMGSSQGIVEAALHLCPSWLFCLDWS